MELEEKLKQYQEKTDLVEKALSANPTNVALQTARRELLEIIELTKKVINQRNLGSQPKTIISGL